MRKMRDFFESVEQDTILVAYDLGNNTRESLQEYLTEKVKAEYRADSTYEFNKEKTSEKWDDIITKMKNSITKKDDIIWVWKYTDNQLKVRVFR